MTLWGIMKQFSIIIIFLSICFAGELTLMFWNVENLFDIYDDPKTKDGDFMPGAAKRYTYRSYCLKSQHLADVINYVNPDILALVEIENQRVLENLRNYLYQYKDWEIFIRPGPDIRGIDPALMYRESRVNLVKYCYYPVFIAERGYHSRPIMRIDLSLHDSQDTVSVFINHWSSRRGGKTTTDPYRLYAADILLTAVIETHQKHPDYHIIMTGDFNDGAYDTSLKYLYKDTDIRYLEKHLPRGVHGTYYYDGEWICFDHFLIYDSISSGMSVKDVSIVAPFWIREKRTNGPLRFYKGIKILGGYSDHFPICLNLSFNRKSVE